MAHPDISDQPFLDYRHYLEERYGHVLYRVPIDLGFGCPHRQANGQGGCAFCAPNGARAAHLQPGMDLQAQVASGIRLAREHHGARDYIAYFQAGTATHAPLDILRERVAVVLAAATFPIVVFATRPDCLPPPILDWLAELGREHEVWVELGVQTCHDATLTRLRRGHDVACTMRAARDLHARHLGVAAQVILGLPGEGPDEFRETARRLREEPFGGIKIHHLNILRGSDFEASWRGGEIAVMDEHAYGEVLMDFLREIPANWPVMRLSADAPAEQLLAPHWWMTKAEFRHYIGVQMQRRGWRQGDRLATANPDHAPRAGTPPPDQTQLFLPPPPPCAGRPASSPLAILLRAAHLRAQEPAGSAVALAIGFGRGHLALDGVDLLPRQYGTRVILHALACDPTALADRRLDYPGYSGLLTALAVCGRCQWTGIKVLLHRGDPRHTVVRLAGRADLVLLEPETIDALPAVFTLDFLRRVVHLLAPDGVLLSACASPALRGTLLRLGLSVGRSHDPAWPRGGTLAAWKPASLRFPLPEPERRLALECGVGLPYRDRALNWPTPRILDYRERLAARMQRRGLPATLPVPVDVSPEDAFA
jgi:radical SAM protein (TIGR01212 family)